MKPYTKSRRRGDDEPQQHAKPKSQCSYEDCESLWTHSDVPGSHTGMCGYHYHAKKGHEELAEWRERNEQARKDIRRVAMGLSRYDLPVPERTTDDTVFDRAARRVRREAEAA